jgi:hypothetical protein
MTVYEIPYSVKTKLCDKIAEATSEAAFLLAASSNNKSRTFSGTLRIIAKATADPT